MTGGRSEMKEVVITRGSARQVDRRALARLVYESYAEVAKALRVKKETALAMLQEAVELEQCFVAWKGESVVGFLGLVERKGHPFHFRFKLIRAHCGFLRSLIYFLLLNARTWRKPPSGQIKLENLVVSVAERKQGGRLSSCGTCRGLRHREGVRERGRRSRGHKSHRPADVCPEVLRNNQVEALRNTDQKSGIHRQLLHAKKDFSPLMSR